MSLPSRSTTVLTLIAVVAALALGRELFLPLFLAGFFAFLLAPLASFLERRARMPTVLAVVLTVALGVGLLTGVGYVVTTEVASVVDDLPKYRENLKRKLGVVAGVKKQLEVVRKDLEEIEGTVAGKDEPSEKPSKEAQGAVAVTVVDQPKSRFTTLIGKYLLALLRFLGAGAIVLLFVPFFLIARTSLRNRLIALLRDENVFLTAHAVDEATERVSSYLLATVLVNVAYGVPVAIGVHLIGLPHAFLWGLLAALLRFIPYVGPWTAALLITAVAGAVFPGWEQLVAVVALLVTLELIMNNLLEPWAYGKSTGLSTLAVLVSAFFWSWLWGIPGLFLAMPITLCLAVVGRYVPSLGFLHTLLSSSDREDRHTPLFQRLAIGDIEGASLIASEHVEQEGWTAVVDRQFVPALRLIQQENAEGMLDDERAAAMARALAEMADRLPEPSEMLDPALGPVHVETCADPTAVDRAHARVLRAALQAMGIATTNAGSTSVAGTRVCVAASFDPELHGLCKDGPDQESELPPLICVRRAPRADLENGTAAAWPEHAISSAAELIRRLQRAKQTPAGTAVAIPVMNP